VSKQAREAFEKQVVRLPDGRELTYYWFPEYQGPRPEQGTRGGAPAPDKAGSGRDEER
jgi:hypothetical protein